MTRRAVPFLVLVLSLPLFAAAPARADDAGPTLELEHLDLLPLGEFEREDLRRAHPELSRTLQVAAYRIRSLRAQLEKRDRRDDEEGKKIAAEIAGLETQVAGPLAELRADLLPHGLTDAMILQMDLAPDGPGRVERYSHHLVLMLDDLDDDQRRIFERVVPEVDGAWLLAQALEDRTKLALDQSGLEAKDTRGVLAGFRRQTSVVESRFWRLVDYVLADDQKAALWEMLPTSMRRHASPQDHVLALPGLEPAQAARVQALVTEVEAESAPDQALVARVRAELRAKDLAREKRDALTKEQREGYQRLQALRRYAWEQTHEILTDAQIRAMKAIPPRVSINDRRRNGRLVLDGMRFDEGQRRALDALRKEARPAARAYQERMRDLRKEGADVGPDSPQQMMMQMMAAETQGEALAVQRHLLGRAFREILTPDQVSGWVMGLYGYRR